MDDGLTPDQVAVFERDGAVLVENAFPTVLADRGRALLCRDLPARNPGSTLPTRPPGRRRLR